MPSKKNIGTMVIAGAGSGVGGYLIGSSADANRTTKATSAIMSYGVLAPLLIGGVGYFLLRKKNPNAARGLAVGGAAGAAYGFYKFGKPATSSSTADGSQASTGTGAGGGTGAGTGAGTGGTAAGGGTGTGSTGTSAYLGRMRRRKRMARMARMGRMGAMPGRVRRILTSPNGSGLGDMIFRGQGSSAFRNPWSN
jgi:hypothetical protein